MAAYILANVEIQDPAGFEDYRKQVPATVEKYGGKFLVRGGKFERLEGDWQPKRLVVLQFDNAEKAKRWYHSDEYRAPKALRQRTAKTDVILVEGA